MVEQRLINIKPLMSNGWHLVQTGESNRFIRSMSLADVPVVEAKEVVHGVWQFWEGWMSNHDMRIDDATCSICGYRHPTVRRTLSSDETEQEVLNKLSNFCANCGADMR